MVLIIAGCASPRAHEPVAKEPRAAHQATFADIEVTVGNLSQRLSQQLESCMSGKGFHQLSRFRKEYPIDARRIRTAMGIDIGELGPSSETEANMFGMLGMQLAFRSDGYPAVDPQEDSYFLAAQKCKQPSTGAARSMMGAWSVFLNQERTLMLKATGQAIEKSLRTQITCVKQTYPNLSKDALIQGDSASALKAAGIVAGISTAETKGKTVLMERVKVWLPGAKEEYAPSASEIAFGLIWVKCARVNHLKTGVDTVVAKYVGEREIAIAERLSQFQLDADTSLRASLRERKIE